MESSENSEEDGFGNQGRIYNEEAMKRRIERIKQNVERIKSGVYLPLEADKRRPVKTHTINSDGFSGKKHLTLNCGHAYSINHLKNLIPHLLNRGQSLICSYHEGKQPMTVSNGELILKSAERIPGLVVIDEEEAKVPAPYKCSLGIVHSTPGANENNDQK